ncbi:hypothetical protein [Nocardia yamanashiensis]|uniref:hypothetical protein n=1 Tax=Nocardia yamanashiensis TaxID=209247 RepID=UPI0012FDD031|nr:hypothetical protein [Nocardia yamanashiensis]
MSDSNVLALWPVPETAAQRWRYAQLKIRLSLAYGRPSGRRRARMLARRYEP